mmetsp:Transcript_39486/g.104190  ORF Transcript_39486/g.104190 Transcript_39486/m.104190 type:complete len:227 (+) Transcript_39486:505-1185(+)
MAGAPLALLLRGVRLRVHGLHRLHEQVGASLGLVHGCAEELQAAHVGRTLDLHAALAALLDDFLQLLRRVLGRLLVLGLRCLLLLLLLLVLLAILLVHLHLLQGVRLRLHRGDAWDRLQRCQEVRLRGERGLLPSLKGRLRELRDDLEVVATPTHDALHARHPLHGAHLRQDLLQLGLRGHERGVVGVRRKLAAPFAGDVLKIDERHRAIVRRDLQSGNCSRFRCT